MCTNDGKQERAVGRHPGLDAPYGSGGIGANTANSVAPLGPKCLVAGCNNRFGEGVFHGELCSPCHRMIVTGVVHPAGDTFVHSMQRALASAAEQNYMRRAEALVDARVREWRGAGSELRGTVVGLVVNALKEGEKNAEEWKRQSQ